MRNLRCATCGLRWHSSRGAIYSFVNEHIRRHGLVEPTNPGMDFETFFAETLQPWREKYFPEER